MQEFDLKPIQSEAVPRALEKAERYRLLNEPAEAESICLDVLAIDPDNQEALVVLLLALTDQFRAGLAECFTQAQAVVPRLQDEYQRNYYSGIIWERRGHALALHSGPGSGSAAYNWIQNAMDFYETAERLRPAGNDDAILRWNTCVRLCQRFHLHPEAEEAYQPVLGED
ncbi:MAG: hypothetical protein L0Y72_02990 [Gemmataceae bacterium]|nr:hypothetical protein [Gemmataceae bacterium]MCI0737983.1 hypothetical protein [Gemmataceae bacterium]